jgi:hypothetical protein
MNTSVVITRRFIVNEPLPPLDALFFILAFHSVYNFQNNESNAMTLHFECTPKQPPKQADELPKTTNKRKSARVYRDHFQVDI